MKLKFLVLSLLIFLFSFLIAEEITLNMIQVFTSPLRTKVLEKIISDFEKMHPGVKINLISPPYETAYQKIYLMVSTNQPLDIVEVGDWSLSSLASMGKLENLEPYIAKWEDKKYLLPGVLDSARIYKGTAYLIPNAVYVKALFYRKDILEKYGYKEPPKTVEEMYEMAKNITDPSKNQYGFDFRGKGFPTAFIDLIMTSYFDDIDPSNMYLTKDGKLIFEDPRAKKGLEMYVKLYRDTAPRDSINWGFDEQVNAFASGITPLLYQDPDTLGLLKDTLPKEKFGIAPLPVGPSGKAYPTFGFAGWGITSYSKHKDLAWEFIKYFNSPEVNAYWCKEYGALPVDKRVYDMDPYFNSEFFYGWKYMFNHPEIYQFTAYPLANEKWGEWNNLHEKTMQKVLLGKMSIDEVLKKWADFWKKAGLK